MTWAEAVPLAGLSQPGGWLLGQSGEFDLPGFPNETMTVEVSLGL